MTKIKDAGYYKMLGNVPGKEQDGINEHLLDIWGEVENWYGDIQKKESGRNFLLRIQSKYDITPKNQ